MQWNGETLSGLPAMPVFETFVGAVLLVGILYYLVSGQRGKEDTAAEPADAAHRGDGHRLAAIPTSRNLRAARRPGAGPLAIVSGTSREPTVHDRCR